MARLTGATLWELTLTLALVGVALGVGIPSFESIVLDTRRRADMQAFVGSIQRARSESLKRARSVVLCKTRDLQRCGDASVGYDAGWMVFVNEDDDRPPHRASAEPLLFAYRPESDGPIASNRARFEFRPFRRRSTNGTVTFCDRRGAADARAVIVSYTGRPRIDSRGPGGRPLRCDQSP